MERKSNGLISSDSSCIISMSLRQCFGIHRTHAIPILTGNSRSSIEIIACKCTLGRYRLKTGVSYKWQGYMNVLPIYNWFLYHFFPVNYLTTRSLVPRSSCTCAKTSGHCKKAGIVIMAEGQGHTGFDFYVLYILRSYQGSCVTYWFLLNIAFYYSVF